MTNNNKNIVIAVPDLCLEANRLSTFKSWPFNDKAICNKIKMAEAGFYKAGGPEEEDAVCCFLCGKLLDGWEENDDPWAEHRSHAANCMFVRIGKPEEIMTLEEFLNVVNQCAMNEMKKETERIISLYMSEINHVKIKIKSANTNI